MPRCLASASVLVGVLLLATGCGRGADQDRDLNQLDRELTEANAAGRDPAIADAINGQIMVDPNLQQSSNANAVRPAPRPDSGATPADVPGRDPVDARTLRHAPPAQPGCPQCGARARAYTLGALAAAQPRSAACAQLSYSAAWANRLPPELPLYPDARVTEAAGNATGACHLRAVSFRSSAPAAKLIDWYFTHVQTAGYSAEHRTDGAMQVLGGTRGEAAYVVYVTPHASGAEVDLITNAGR